MGITRRAVVATAAGAAALTLGGCTGPWYGLSSGYADDEAYADLSVDGEESGGEGWTSYYGDDQWPATSWEQDHEDAVPVLDVTVTAPAGGSPGQVVLDVSADLSTPSGWTTSENWYSGPLDADERTVTVHGSPSHADLAGSTLTVNAWDTAGLGHDVYWYGTIIPTADGGWALDGGGSTDSPIEVAIDLESGDTAPESQPFTAASSWATSGMSPQELAVGESWADTFDDGAEVAVITVEGEAPEGTVLAASASVWGMQSDASAPLLTTEVEGSEEIVLVGPSELVEGADAYSYVDLSLWVESEAGFLTWSQEVTVEDGAWLLDGEPIDLVLDLGAGTITTAD